MQPMIVMVERAALERAVRMCERLAPDDAGAVVIVSSPGREPAVRLDDALPPVPAPALGAWPVDLPQLLRGVEAQYIEAALAATGGNRQAAADLLGLKRTTLVEKLRRRPPDASNRPVLPASAEVVAPLEPAEGHTTDRLALLSSTPTRWAPSARRAAAAESNRSAAVTPAAPR
jgi:Bacterial regulatory protein, Fis family